MLRGDGAYLLEDLGSTNGTYLNGWRIPASQLLSTGDRIQVGQTVLEVVLAPDPQRTAMRRRPVILAGTARRGGAAHPALAGDSLREWRAQVLRGLRGSEGG